MLVKLDDFPRDRGKNKKYFKPPPRIFGGANIWNNAFWRKTGELYRTKVWQNVFQLESYLQGEFQDKHVSNHQLECKPEVFYLLKIGKNITLLLDETYPPE